MNGKEIDVVYVGAGAAAGMPTGRSITRGQHAARTRPGQHGAPGRQSPLPRALFINNTEKAQCIHHLETDILPLPIHVVCTIYEYIN